MTTLENSISNTHDWMAMIPATFPSEQQQISLLHCLYLGMHNLPHFIYNKTTNTKICAWLFACMYVYVPSYTQSNTHTYTHKFARACMHITHCICLNVMTFNHALCLQITDQLACARTLNKPAHMYNYNVYAHTKISNLHTCSSFCT
jgi:hypothetical protein